MTPERLEELKLECDATPEQKWITISRDKVRDLIYEVERLNRLKKVINQNHSPNGYIFVKDLRGILEDTP